MNITTLTNYFTELQTLRNYNAIKNIDRAQDLQIKIMDALKELGLYDGTSVKVANVKFKPFFSSSPDPYYDSLRALSSHLESKISVYEHRLELAAQNAKIQRESTITFSKEEYDIVSKALLEARDSLVKVNNEVIKLKAIITTQNSQIEENDIALKRKLKIWKIASIGVWSFIIATFLGLIGLAYMLGRDNATKTDENEKHDLQRRNIILQDSLDSIKQIDSLKTINKKG